MRVLILSNLLPPRIRGGYELACYNLAKGLIARGHDVQILTTDTELIPVEDQSFVDRSFQLRRYQDVSASNSAVTLLFRHESLVSLRHNSVVLLAKLREFRPDHVISFNLLGIGGVALLDVLNSVGAPWTLNMGDRVPSTLLEGMTDEMAEVFGAVNGEVFHAGQIAAISQTIVDETIAAGIHLGDRIRIISRGVIPHGHVRQVGYHEGGTTRFVFAGTVGPEKGMDIVLGAARLLLGAPVKRNFTIDVFGTSGIFESYVERTRELGLSGHITFHGSRPQREIIEVESRSDAFLFPTWTREALGNAPLEAASVGCVPIITATCGAAERLVDGVHCVKIERNDAALAAAMAAVIDGDVDLERLGSAGVRLAAGDLSFSRSLDLLETFVEEGARPGWQDGRLDDPTVGTEIVAKDNRSVRLFHQMIEERGLRGRPTIRTRLKQRIGA